MAHVDKFDFITYSKFNVHGGNLIKRSLSTPGRTDSFVLELQADNKTFCLQMHPNEELLHPQAQWTDYDSSQSVFRRTVQVKEITTKVYKGYVTDVDDHTTDGSDYECKWNPNLRANSNWARLTLKDEMFYSTNLRKRDLTGEEERNFAVHYEGAMKYKQDIYTIKTVRNYEFARHPDDAPVPSLLKRHLDHQSAELLAFKLSDLKQPQSSTNDSWCGFDHLPYNNDGSASKYFELKQRELGLRQSAVDNPIVELLTKGSKELLKRSTVYTGCPTTTKVVYVVVASDCSYHQRMNFNSQQAQDKIIDDMNIVSAIYQQDYNIILGVLEVKTMPDCGGVQFNQAYSTPYTISNRLSDFSQYRGTFDAKAGLWHLFSNGSTAPTVGLAWLGQVCQTSAFKQTDSNGKDQYVSGTAVSTVTLYTWMVVAHEIGHNFGSLHDCQSTQCSQCTSVSSCGSLAASCYPGDDNCAAPGYLMASSSSFQTSINEFSVGTKKQICGKINVLGTCMQDPGALPVLNKGICGNGIKEGDEACDCGGDVKCLTSQCCFANCTLKAQARCDDTNDNCCRNCTAIPAAEKKVCREAISECDITEQCAGNATCPPDIHLPNGLKCQNATGFGYGEFASDSLTCTTGVCSNRKSQCIIYGGNGAKGDCPAYSGQCEMFCNIQIEGCVKVSSKFIDGTPCGNDGVCQAGICSNPDFIGGIIQWFFANQNLALVVIIVIVLIFMFLMAQCLRKAKADKRTDIIQQARLQEDEIARMEKMEREQRKRENQRIKRSSQV